MTKKVPYPLEKLVFHLKPENLSMEGGTIETAIFQEPKLLEYTLKFPKGFGFPQELAKIINSDDEITLKISEKHSDKNEVIFTGLSSTLYSRFNSDNSIENRINSINTFRFQIMLEQQSIISLVSVLETFIKSVQTDHDQNKKIYHYFTDVMKQLKKCDITRNDLKLLNDDKIYSRTKEIIDYSFNLRNLYVHNGGIIDELFLKKYKNKIDENKIRLLIRLDYTDYDVIRQWLSFFIQEICRVVEGYNNVWTDYLLSTGILLPDTNLILKMEDKEEHNISLEDGVELTGIYEDEIENKSFEDKPVNDKRSYKFQLDLGKLIEKKISK
jgi:hypothetical protein